MTAVVAFVLLIACANVGNLLLVRSFARRHEMTVRMAIGATSRRLLKQLLTEGLILASIGAAGGLLVAFWCRHALVLLFPVRSGRTMYLPGEIDWQVLLLTAGICLAATLILGLVPALQSRNIDLAGALKSESSNVTSARRRAWMRSGLVVLQVCLSFILLAGAVLLLESLQKIRTASPGFSTTRVVETGVSLVAAGYDAQRARTFQDELIDRVRALPGVESAAYARVTPLGYGTFSSTTIAVDGYQPPPGEQPMIDYNQVGPEYFATLGIPLLTGREFTRADDETAPLVAIVNRTMKARYWGDQDLIGLRLQVKDKWARVIGVAADSKYESMREDPKPFFYVAAVAGFFACAGLEYPDNSTSAEYFGGRAPRSARPGREPRPLRDDHASGTGRSFHLAATRGRHSGFDPCRFGASSLRSGPLWSHVLCGGAEYARARAAHRFRGSRRRPASSRNFARLEINRSRPLPRRCRRARTDTALGRLLSM